MINSISSNLYSNPNIPSTNRHSPDIVITNPNNPNDKIIYKGEIVDSINKSFQIYKEYYENLKKDIPVLKGSIQDQISKGQMSQAEINTLDKWKNENLASMQWINDDFEKEYIKIYHTSMSINEFKEKWLELQTKQTQYTEDFRKQNEENIKKEMANQIPQTTNNQNTSINSTSTTKDNQTQDNQETNKTFKPIQGESKNKTYTNNYMNETLKKLLENKFDKKQLFEMLFGIKSNDDTNNVNFRKLISQMGLNNIKSIDIKV